MSSSRRIHEYVEALVAEGGEGDRRSIMGEPRHRFGRASNGDLQ